MTCCTCRTRRIFWHSCSFSSRVQDLASVYLLVCAAPKHSDSVCPERTVIQAANHSSSVQVSNFCFLCSLQCKVRGITVLEMFRLTNMNMHWSTSIQTSFTITAKWKFHHSAYSKGDKLSLLLHQLFVYYQIPLFKLHKTCINNVVRCMRYFCFCCDTPVPNWPV